jgi:hypothetical protein
MSSPLAQVGIQSSSALEMASFSFHAAFWLMCTMPSRADAIGVTVRQRVHICTFERYVVRATPDMYRRYGESSGRDNHGERFSRCD